MEIVEKIKILAESAKYDVSCSSSGSDRKNTKKGIGNGSIGGICHSWSEDGRCISLLKILFSNACIYDCTYCVNRISNDFRRATFTPDELADLTINFYKRNYIEGLFLSSAVIKSPDHTMELIIKSVKKLRLEYNFNGYIHIKAIPGANPSLIHEAGLYADRMSVNIELPSEKSLKLLAPQKNKEDIITPMKYIKNQISETKSLKKIIRKTPAFVPAGQTTQLMVGASSDTDHRIISLSQSLYDTFSLKRVYYSGYVPINSHPNLPTLLTTPPMLREHRLYQADWLLRFYGFRANELLDNDNENFDIDLDPKCDWALRNLQFFPVEINKVDYQLLLRVPGIGVKSAQKIIGARRFGPLTFDNLVKLKVVIKRAKYFITCGGRYYGETDIDSLKIKNKLLLSESKNNFEQISIFTMPGVH